MYCPECKKEVGILVERTDPKGNGYQFIDELSCEECGEILGDRPTDYGEIIDEAMSRME